jgi:hypothetical protein
VRPSLVPAALLLLLGLGTALGGCSRKGTRQVTVLDPTDMPCSGIDPDTGIWSSAPWPISEDIGAMGDAGTSGICEWLPFAGRQELIVPHTLGYVPSEVLVYIAFTPSGVGGTLASGDPGRVRAVDDAFVTIDNGTNQDFYVRLVLE